MRPNQQQIGAYLRAIKAIADTIREVGETNEGTLYAGCMSVMSLETFQGIMRRLAGAGVIEVTAGHAVRWIGG